MNCSLQEQDWQFNNEMIIDELIAAAGVYTGRSSSDAPSRKPFQVCRFRPLKRTRMRRQRGGGVHPLGCMSSMPP